MNYPLPTPFTTRNVVTHAEYLCVPEYRSIQVFALEKQKGLAGFFSGLPEHDPVVRSFWNNMTWKQKILLIACVVFCGAAIVFLMTKRRRR